MKKKIMVSLLVGSAVVGASLAPLSAQAVTTGNTPVQAEFGGDMLPDAGGNPSTMRPDPGATDSSFDLVFIPREHSFGKLSISDDLARPIPNRNDADRNGHTEAISIGDLRGTEKGWYVTAQSNGMKLGGESLGGNTTIGVSDFYALKYGENTNQYTNQGATIDMEARPEDVNPDLWNLPLTDDTVLIVNATSGRGQGIWGLSMFGTTLNTTISACNIKAGAYTGNTTWNLVAGPSV